MGALTDGVSRAGAAIYAAVAQVGRDLWPSFQGGLQDLQHAVERPFPDSMQPASVPGQAGLSTQRELYELSHEDQPKPGVQPPARQQDNNLGATFESFAASQQPAQMTREPELELER